MSIRKTIFLIICLTLAGLVGSVWWTGRFFLLKQASEMESSLSLSKADAARNFIEAETKALLAVAWEWAAWDDAYSFAAKPNRQFAATYLNARNLKKQAVDWVVFIGKDGRPFISCGFDRDGNRLMLPPALANMITAKDFPSRLRAEHEGAGGLLFDSENSISYLAAAYPILKGDFTGPAHGVILFLRRLDDKAIAPLRARIAPSVRVLPPAGQQPGDVSFVPENGHEMSVSVALPELDGRKTAAILKAVFPRDYYRHISSTLGYFMWATIFLSLALMGVIYYALEKYVLSRVDAVTAFARNFGPKINSSERIHLKGRDELSDLADAVNSMLDSLRLEFSISERKSAELLRARQAAEASSEAKGRFIDRAESEIRGPMHSIMGFTELASPSVSDPRVKECLDNIRDSAQTVMHSLSALSDFSQIQKGRLEAENAPFSLHQLVAQTTGLFMLSAQAKSISMQLAILPEVPDMVVGDRRRIGQVLFNIIDYSLRRSPGGRVSISLSSEEKPGGKFKVHAVVQDSGSMLSPADVDSLFRFEDRGPNVPPDSKYRGAGVGLCIARRILEILGGNFWAEKGTGAGMLFHFTFMAEVAGGRAPAYRAGPAAPEAVQPAVSRGLKILLAEDSAINQKLVIAMLRREGHQVVCVSNGKEAVEAVKSGTFDIVLMDVQMPELDGLAAASAIRDFEKTLGRHTPILALTAHSLPEDREKCLSAGMDGHVSKPINAAVLLASIGRMTAPQ